MRELEENQWMEINILSIYVIPMHMFLVTFKSSFSKKKKKKDFVWLHWTGSWYVLIYLKAQLCKLYHNKHIITSTQKTNTEINFCFHSSFSFYVILFINRKTMELLKGRLAFKKITYFAGKLLQSYKYLECEVFRILMKQWSYYLSVLFQFAWLYL